MADVTLNMDYRISPSKNHFESILDIKAVFPITPHLTVTASILGP